VGLEQLVLDGNAIGDEGGAAVAELASALPTLRALSVARCELRQSALISLSVALAATGPRASALASLDVSEPRLFSRNEETTYHLAKALRANVALEHLAMRKHPHLSDAGVASLCDFLLDNAAAGGRLESLDVSSNRLGPPSGVTFARAFESGLALRALNLSRCRIGDEGAVALARSLGAAGGGRLERLDLRACGVGDEGNEALAEWLGGPACGLRECLLFGNDSSPGARGTTALGVALMSGAVRCATDLKAYVVDDAMMLAEQALGFAV
jgi:Ran GTPase-activating protein (RanGAP) involved in mRNA processing and transport